MTGRPSSYSITFIELPAADVEGLSRAKAFYGSVFGWVYKDWGDDYADTKGSGLESGLNADPAHRPKHPMPVIYAEDLESAREKIIHAEGKLIRDIFSFPGGRRFHATDPCGNEIAVWSDK